MIDLNCRLLHETPCGPATLAAALEVCRSASGEGVTSVVAAPCWDTRRAAPPLPLADYLSRLAQLREAAGGLLRLTPGFALRFGPGLLDVVDEHGRRLTLNGGRHLLISLPSLSVPAESEEVWEGLRQRGYAVVLARPECNQALRRDAERLRRWVAGGITLQLDAASLAGSYGRHVRQFALRCAGAFGGSVVLGSGGVARGAGQGYLMGVARAALRKGVGAGRARRIVSETAEAILTHAAPRKPETSAGGAARPLDMLLRRLKTTGEFLTRAF